MIDKLDVAVPADTSFTTSFQRLYSELRLNPKTNPFRPTRHYLAVADLRPYDHEAILHMSCKWGKHGDHKIELTDTGLRTFAGLVNEVESIFAMNAMKCRVMRLDLATDVKGIPVSWFQRRIKANYKRFITNFGSSEFVETGKGGIQTLYFGKRPNLFRIYDKVAEYRMQYQKILRQLKNCEQKPDFKELFGVSETDVITRVERQIGGKIPEKYSTVEKLKQLESFSPFESLNFIVGGKAEPDPNNYGFEEYCTGMHLREMAEAQGMHAAMRFIREHGNRNTGKILAKFRDFLPEEHPDQMINAEFLNASYRESVARQLAA